MKIKYVLINTPLGQFKIPALAIAKHRANEYYTDKESKEWQNSVDYLMQDDDEIIDWCINNSDWIDWVDIATKVSDKVLVTDRDFWTNSDDFEIIEVEV